MAVNSASNVGTGRQVFKQLSGTDLQFRTLTQGNGMTLTQNANDIASAVNQAYSFNWTGQHKFLGSTAEASIPSDAAVPGANLFSACISRTAQSGNDETVQPALLIKGATASNTDSFEWLQLNFLDDYASNGENTPFYSKAYKRSAGPIWGGVFEVKNWGSDQSAAMYGLEISLQSNGTAATGMHVGCALYYGGLTAVASEQEAGIRISPMAGQDLTANLRYGVVVAGKAGEAFAASANGNKAFAAYGSYSTAAIDLSLAASAPIGLYFGRGQRIKFTSGTGSGGNNTWYSGAFTPAIVGALEILVDGTTLYVPVCSNHP